MKNKTKEIKLPFDCILYDKVPVKVANPYTGESCMLTPEAVAVYDVIKGAEMANNFDLVRKGLDWFREHFADEYMVLLD